MEISNKIPFKGVLGFLFPHLFLCCYLYSKNIYKNKPV